MAAKKHMDEMKPEASPRAIMGPGQTFGTVTDRISAIVLARGTPASWFRSDGCQETHGRDEAGSVAAGDHGARPDFRHGDGQDQRHRTGARHAGELVPIGWLPRNTWTR